MGQLGIHIIGAGYGESIILELPNGGFGVIDCYCTSLQAETHEDFSNVNPTLRLLKQLGAKKLAFLAFTHPHEDHGRGVSQLLKFYRNQIDEIWIYEAYQDESLHSYFTKFFDDGFRLTLEELDDELPGTFAAELSDIAKLVNKERAELLCFSGIQKNISIAGEKVVAHFLGPTERSAKEYQRKFIKNIANSQNPKNKVDPDWEPSKINHNLASPAIIFEYGKTRILLGGDMEKAAWDKVVANSAKAKGIPLSACFVKAAHHGSKNGFADNLYKEICHGGNKPIVVITPYNRNKHALPHPLGIMHLHEHSKELLVTNAEAAKKSLSKYSASLLRGTELLVTSQHKVADQTKPQLTEAQLQEINTILERWKNDYENDENLLWLLNRDKLDAPQPKGRKKNQGIPENWSNDIISHPELLDFLAEDASIKMASVERRPPIEKNYRISFYFDDQGNETHRYVGSGTGKITTQQVQENVQ